MVSRFIAIGKLRPGRRRRCYFCRKLWRYIRRETELDKWPPLEVRLEPDRWPPTRFSGCQPNYRSTLLVSRSDRAVRERDRRENMFRPLGQAMAPPPATKRPTPQTPQKKPRQ